MPVHAKAYSGQPAVLEVVKTAAGRFARMETAGCKCAPPPGHPLADGPRQAAA